VTRAERDRLIADQHLIITLANGVCESKVQAADEALEDTVSTARAIWRADARAASLAFYAIKNEAEAEIARLEGLEVTE